MIFVRIIYIGIIVACLIFLMVMYFTNIIYMGNYPMYLGSQSNHISVGLGLLLTMLTSFVLGFVSCLLTGSLVKRKPKDFDEIGDL